MQPVQGVPIDSPLIKHSTNQNQLQARIKSIKFFVLLWISVLLTKNRYPSAPSLQHYLLREKLCQSTCIKTITVCKPFKSRKLETHYDRNFILIANRGEKHPIYV
ncbi:hypothetical protein JTB14_029207 [Gonioctena quinquepunctata]|nr:hypothetical protein JTB14_029207 [Gonioctena quinquepunctata]